MLVHDDACLIHGPVLDGPSPNLTAYEVNLNDHWVKGLNELNWNAEYLENFVHTQVALELQWNVVGITHARHELERGLVVLRPFKEGDVIMRLAPLFFDEANFFKKFASDFGLFYDKTVLVQNVRAPNNTFKKVLALILKGLLAGQRDPIF